MPRRRRGAALGLRARLLLVLAPVLAILFVFDSWNDTHTLGLELEKAYDQSLIEPVQALADRVDWDEQGRVDVTDVVHVMSMLESVGSSNQYLRVELRSLDGRVRRVLLGSQDFPEPPPMPGAGASIWQATDGAEVYYNANYHQRSLRVAAQLHDSLDPEGTRWRLLVQAARGTRAIDTAKRDLLWQTLWRDARTLLILGLVVWLGVGWGLRPLQALRRRVQQRAPDDLRPLAADLAPGEVAPLVDALNQHLARQRQALEAQRQFLADASHQLRTPLAILHTQAGYALREPDPAEVRRTLQGMLQQLQHSRRVCEQLLALAQAHQTVQSTPSDVQMLRCDANAVAREVVIQYLPLARSRHIDLGWCDARGNEADDDASDVAPVQATAEALHEAVANLVHNAIVYTPPQGRVSVSVKLLAQYCEVWVQDTGPGIAPADRERVFKRFERLADRRGAAPAVPGSGLGLAIAQALVQRMGGQIELNDGEGGVGLTACVRLLRAL